MEESFKLRVKHKNTAHEISVTLKATAFSARFIAVIDDQEVTIEKDEQGGYRAYQQNDHHRQADKELVGLLVEKIEEVFV